MKVLMVGIDHNRADIDVRSAFSFTKKESERAYGFFMERPEIEGCVIISTCNRMELWLSVDEDETIEPVELLCEFKKLEANQYADVFIKREDKEAVNHLFRLAAGLDSKILGEGQIITQISDALIAARSVEATDHTIEVLFRNAITAGKRVRTETDLSLADRSVITIALEKLENTGFSVKGKKCMVIGNGMMGRLSAEALLSRGADVTVTIRKYHSGIVDVPVGCKRIDYDERYNHFDESSLVVSATSSPNFTITSERLSQVTLDSPVIVLDLAVPRDVEPSISKEKNISLYDVDSFNIDFNTEKLKYNLSKVDEIIEEEQSKFYEWYEGRDIVPTIIDFKEFTGNDTVIRMKQALKNSSLNDEEKTLLEGEIKSASERMMNHLLFSLRGQLSDKNFREVMDSLVAISEDRTKEWRDTPVG